MPDHAHFTRLYNRLNFAQQALKREQKALEEAESNVVMWRTEIIAINKELEKSEQV